eukprot:983480-Rhodomonas_salina.3
MHIALCPHYAVSGTEIACGGTEAASGKSAYVTGKKKVGGLSAYARATRCPVLTLRMLQPAYAMSGTNVAYASSCICTPYAMSGTGIADAAISQRVRYAMPGTDSVWAYVID